MDRGVLAYPATVDRPQRPDADWRGAKIRQYPCGLIVPSTRLQLLGGRKWTHSLHRFSPFGWSW
jgi:hypothetical protein